MHCLPVAIPANRSNGRSNNAKDGTSTARDSFPLIVPERMLGTSAARGLSHQHLDFSRRR